MTDAAPPTRTDTLGVVDPMHVPGSVGGMEVRAADAWRRLPTLGKAFVVLAIVRVLAGALGVAGTSLFIDLSYPFTVVSGLLIATLPILLPAFLLMRRPDAAAAMPLVFRGAVVLALVAFLQQPVSAFAFGLPGGGGFVAGVSVGIARTLFSASGWLAIAVGLGAVTSSRPGPALAGLANLVLGALVAAAIVQLALLLVSGQPDLGDPTWNAMSMLGNAMFTVEAAVLAYLAFVLVRGTNDTRRPAAARYLATSAWVLAAALAAMSAVVGAVTVVQIVFALSRGAVGGEIALAWLGGWPVIAATLVALALGLADNSVRIPAADRAPRTPADPGPDPVHWPAPGGEVPTFRPIAAAPSEPSGPAPGKKPRRRKPKEA